MKSLKNKEERINKLYEYIASMINARNESHKYFNDRTLTQFINDNERRWNSYTPTKEQQNKEDWQANVFTPVTRNKVKAILATMSAKIPIIDIEAYNTDKESDKRRAFVIDALVKESYQSEGLDVSTSMQNFYEALELVTLGTVIVHSTYEKREHERKTVTSYDETTGEYEFDTKKEIVRDKCVDTIVPLQELFVSSMFCKNGSIQEQERIATIKYYTEEEFELDFGKYKKATEVNKKSKLFNARNERVMQEQWEKRCESEKKDIEVIKYYCKTKDEYIILANGVILVDAPLLWEYQGEKVYPFAKTIFEPFSSNFFYGNSLPNTLLGEQDVINSLYNMLLDKTYKGLTRQLLVGDSNRDAFDFDEQTEKDPIIYVSDINQVRESPTRDVSASEFNMLNTVSSGLDKSSVDQNQQGIAGRGVTAREVVIADKNAKVLGGVFRMFMSNIWKQKIILRIVNILIFYTDDKATMTLGEGTVDVKSKILSIGGETLSDNTVGAVNIEIVPKGAPMPTRQELDAREERAEKNGENLDFIAIGSDFIRNWHYNVKISEDSIDGVNDSVEQAKIESKITMLANAFPQLFMLNQSKLFKSVLESHGDNSSEYITEMPEEPQEFAQNNQSMLK